jgi:hypothetical protein
MNDPEVVLFIGHLHLPNNDPRSIWQGGFTAVNTPTTHYISFGRNRTGFLGRSTGGVKHDPFPRIPNDISAQGIIVTVHGSRITIENYDFDFSEGPEHFHGVEQIPQTWEFDVSRPSDFPYTNIIRDTQKTAPVFDETMPSDAGIEGITIRNFSSTALEVEFPQAKIPEPNHGNEIVFSYRFDFINIETGNVERSVRQWSDFLLTPRLQKETYTQLIGGLKPGINYELRVFAYSSFQETSNQYLVYRFKL